MRFYRNLGIFLLSVGVTLLILFVSYNTHKASVITKALDKQEAVATPNPDCYPKEALNVVAVDASKRTVDFIVNKMIEDKYIVVNKDGESYRFKEVKKYKQVKDKK